MPVFRAPYRFIVPAGSLLVGIACVFASGAWAQGLPSGGGRDLYRKLRFKALGLARKGRTDESIPYFRRMARLQPYNEKALWLYALALLHQKRASKGAFKRDARRAVRLLQSCVLMQKRYRKRSRALGLRYFFLGMAFWYAGDSLQALYSFQKAYRADYDRLDAVYNEYALLNELGKKGEATLALRRYIRLVKSSKVDD